MVKIAAEAFLQLKIRQTTFATGVHPDGRASPDLAGERNTSLIPNTSNSQFSNSKSQFSAASLATRLSVHRHAAFTD